MGAEFNLGGLEVNLDTYYQDDYATLYHADLLQHLDMLDQADVLVTDPPYGYNVKLGLGDGNPRRGSSPWANTAIRGDESLESRDTVLEAWGKRPAILFGSWKRPKPIGTKAVLVWDKGPGVGAGDLNLPWKPNWEEIYILGSGFHGHRGTSVLTGHTVVSWASKGREHPNMKPVSLMEALIMKCPPGTIIDPFAGSGSTLRAAKNLGRKCIGFEIEEKYCEITAQRLAQETLGIF